MVGAGHCHVLHRNVWKILQQVKPGLGNEIQLTDAIDQYLAAGGSIEAYHIMDRSYDCGSKLGLAVAYVEHALQHKDIGTDFAAYLKSLCWSAD